MLFYQFVIALPPELPISFGIAAASLMIPQQARPSMEEPTRPTELKWLILHCELVPGIVAEPRSDGRGPCVGFLTLLVSLNR
jgi:hypothetical protein